jgi:hypothetical protein
VRRVIGTALLAAAITVPLVSPADAATARFVWGSDVSYHGCKGWLNWKPAKGGGYMQGVLQSWGRKCGLGVAHGKTLRLNGRGKVFGHWIWAGPKHSVAIVLLNPNICSHSYTITTKHKVKDLGMSTCLA